MSLNKKVIVIAGPTASGKTGLSVEIAKRLNTVVFSGDSRQFYKELVIGTAKPTAEEMDGITHHFVDSHSIHEELTVAQYIAQAEPLLLAEFEKYDTIIITGGSGMFIDSLLYGLDEIPHSMELREELIAFVKENGTTALQAEIREKDPSYYYEMDIHNPLRVMRAVEVLRLTGKKYSDLRKRTKKEQPFDIEYFVIEHPRDELYNRINLRVDKMMDAGLLDEAKSVFEFKELQSLKTVGYTEMFNHFESETSLEEAVDNIKQNSRNYAKRQLTWFKRNKEAVWVPFQDTNLMADAVLNQFVK